MNQAQADTGIRLGAQINPRLYSDIADSYAQRVANSGAREENKPSQLRRIYDELVLLQTRVGNNAERFEQMHPFIQMLKAKVAYAKGRKKVSSEFEGMLKTLIDQVTDVATLAQAKLFLEAFMAYYKVYKND